MPKTRSPITNRSRHRRGRTTLRAHVGADGERRGAEQAPRLRVFQSTGFTPAADDANHDLGRPRLGPRDLGQLENIWPPRTSWQIARTVSAGWRRVGQCRWSPRKLTLRRLASPGTKPRRYCTLNTRPRWAAGRRSSAHRPDANTPSPSVRAAVPRWSRRTSMTPWTSRPVPTKFASPARTRFRACERSRTRRA